jgi:hypothetical protein
MKLNEKRKVIIKLNYNQAHALIGLTWTDYIKHLIIGAVNDNSNSTSS